MIKQVGLVWVSFAKAAPPIPVQQGFLGRRGAGEEKDSELFILGTDPERCGVISPSFSHSSFLLRKAEKVGVQGRDRGSSKERK